MPGPVVVLAGSLASSQQASKQTSWEVVNGRSSIYGARVDGTRQPRCAVKGRKGWQRSCRRHLHHTNNTRPAVHPRLPRSVSRRSKTSWKPLSLRGPCRKGRRNVRIDQNEQEETVDDRPKHRTQCHSRSRSSWRNHLLLLPPLLETIDHDRNQQCNPHSARACRMRKSATLHIPRTIRCISVVPVRRSPV